MKLLLSFLISVIPFSLKAQKTELGIDYGMAYFFYNHHDYGKGLRKAAPSANDNFIAGFTLQKNFANNLYWKTGLSFTLYQQYYSTRLYWGAFEEAYPIVLFPALIGYRSNKRLSLNVNGGLQLALMPDQYEGEFGAIFLDENYVVDSITRGSVNRSFTPVFPLLNLNLGLRYAITPAWSVELMAGYAKGFITITEYDIYYNDGNGRNDQRARQWGTGDFANLSLGLKYALKPKRKQ